MNNINKWSCTKSKNYRKFIFHEHGKKLIKHFAKKGFSVYWGVNGTPPNTLKLFSAKCFIKKFPRSWKMQFWSLQDILLNILLILFNNVLYKCKALKDEGNEWLLLDVNPETMFLQVQKMPKATKIRKCLPKTISWVIW